MKQLTAALLGVSALAFLGGCASMKIPDMDFFKLPEHKEARKDAPYPEVGDAPQAPTDTRSKREWDKAAKTLLAKRDSFNAPKNGAPAKSPEQLQREFDALKAKVNEYKKDDPQ